MPTSTQTLKKEATNAALRYSRGKLRSSAMMSFTLSPSLSGQRLPKSPPVRPGTASRYHDPTRHTKRSSRAAWINAALAEARTGPALDRLTRRRRALDRRIRGPDRRAQPEKVGFV